MPSLVGVCLLLTGLMAPPDPALKAAELKKLEGEWIVVSITYDGLEPPKGLKEMTLTIKGSTYTAVAVDNRKDKDSSSEPSKTSTQTGSITIDPSTTPMQLDDSPDQVSDPKAKEVKSKKAIYKLEGDKLTLCVAKPGLERPTEFESRSKSGATIMVLKRKGK